MNTNTNARLFAGPQTIKLQAESLSQPTATAIGCWCAVLEWANMLVHRERARLGSAELDCRAYCLPAKPLERMKYEIKITALSPLKLGRDALARRDNASWRLRASLAF